MTKKTPDEIYQYVLDYKNNLKDNYNSDQDKHFESSNNLKMQLSNQLILFSSVLLSVSAGYLLSRHTQIPGATNFIVGGIFCFAASVCAGVYNTHSASEYFLKWASNNHKKGEMVYKDHSRTVEELDVLIAKLNKKDSSIKSHSSRIPSYAQSILFACGIACVLIAVCLVAYHH